MRKGFARATMFGVIFSVVIGLVMYFFGYIVTGLFVTGDATQIEGMVDTYMKYTCIVPDTTYCGECLPKWYPGYGIWLAANDCRNCRAGGAWKRGVDRHSLSQLRRRMSRQSDGMDPGICIAADHVFCHYEKASDAKEKLLILV